MVLDPETSVPKAGARVRLWPALATQSEATQLGVILQTFTDTAGEFAFDQVPEGEWAVESLEIPGSRVTVQVAPGALATVLLPRP